MLGKKLTSIIGKFATRKSFGGCIRYCLEDKFSQSQEVECEDRAKVIMYNQCYGTKQELTRQFNEVRQLNPKLSKPVLHITLSLAPGDKLNHGSLNKIVEDSAKSFGFENNQFIAISHRDTRHQHVHIFANRIGFDGKTLSDSNSYKKMASYCRQMEQKYRLQQVLSPRRYLSQEMRQLPRYDQRKMAIKTDLQQCLLQSKAYPEFESLMKHKNYQVIKARGIAFIDSKGVYVKGSELGYSLTKIEKILQLSTQMKQRILLKPGQTNFVQQPAMKLNHVPEENLSAGVVKGLNSQALKMMDDLLKPTLNSENVPSQFIRKNKKKRLSQRL